MFLFAHSPIEYELSFEQIGLIDGTLTGSNNLSQCRSNSESGVGILHIYMVPVV